jgi:hypothetical protein
MDSCKVLQLHTYTRCACRVNDVSYVVRHERRGMSVHRLETSCPPEARPVSTRYDHFAPTIRPHCYSLGTAGWGLMLFGIYEVHTLSRRTPYQCRQCTRRVTRKVLVGRYAHLDLAVWPWPIELAILFLR